MQVIIWELKIQLIFSKKKKIKKFIQIGSSIENGKIKSPQRVNIIKKSSELKSHYGRSKHLATKYLLSLYKNFFFPVTILRLFQVYGPHQDTSRLIPFVISNCSNNYGPNQYHEKLIPFVIKSIISKKPITIYGDGENVRDWLYVEDHISAIDLIFHRSKIGDTYNIGGDNEMTNNRIVDILILEIDKKLNRIEGESRTLVKYIKDRLGHDKRYAIDSSKLKKELGWCPKHTFSFGINKTIDWYLKNLN